MRSTPEQKYWNILDFAFASSARMKVRDQRE